jgi:hypothetical protein
MAFDNIIGKPLKSDRPYRTNIWTPDSAGFHLAVDSVHQSLGVLLRKGSLA